MSKVTGSKALQKRISQATEDLEVAERELRGTLEALPAALRAEKRMISEALQVAIGKVAAAKRKLEGALEK